MKKYKFFCKRAWLPVIPALALIFAISFASCDENETTTAKEVVLHDPNAPIVLTNFEPRHGRIREMVLLRGSNFGTDHSIIRVFFNDAEAKVVGSTDDRILALVPRMPGPESVIRVQIGERSESYPVDETFEYHMAASVTTLAGNGETTRVFDQGLDRAQLIPVYIGADMEGNVFVTDQSDVLIRINERLNIFQVVARGVNHRSQPYVNPHTNVIQMADEGAGSRDRFFFLDPADGWAPKPKYIRTWDENGYARPTGGGSGNRSYESRWHLFDVKINDPVTGVERDMYVTRYAGGHIVLIDPITWNAKIIGLTPPGVAYGAAMHPQKPTEMWFAIQEYSENGDWRNGIYTVDILDETVGEVGEHTPNVAYLASFRIMQRFTAGGHRDGPLASAQFRGVRMINFDTDGNLFVGDNHNHCIRMINTSTMMVETLIGIPEQRGWVDGARETAQFAEVHGIVTDPDNVIYAADFANRRVRRIAVE